MVVQQMSRYYELPDPSFLAEFTAKLEEHGGAVHGPYEHVIHVTVPVPESAAFHRWAENQGCALAG
jgi:hypothetical protein